LGKGGVPQGKTRLASSEKRGQAGAFIGRACQPCGEDFGTEAKKGDIRSVTLGRGTRLVLKRGEKGAATGGGEEGRGRLPWRTKGKGVAREGGVIVGLGGLLGKKESLRRSGKKGGHKRGNWCSSEKNSGANSDDID